MVIKYAPEIIGREEPLETIFNNSIILLPRFRAEIKAKDMIIENLENKVETLRTAVEMLREAVEQDRVVLINIPDKLAESEIRRFVIESKKRGITKFDDLEILERFRIPIEQIDKILKNLVKEGVISERK